MYTNLGDKIENLRTRRNVTQLDLAIELGISRSQLSNIEKGRRAISIEQLKKLCNFFKIEISYFLDDNELSEYASLLNKMKNFYNNKEITQNEKDDMFTSIMQIYLDSKK